MYHMIYNINMKGGSYNGKNKKAKGFRDRV